ncbi:MAG: GNAT family N-acetyltransferase [Acidobacteriota bacterium]
MEFEIRPLEGYAEQLLCLHLQSETWGEDFAECVPPSIQQIVQKMGGVVAGAFEPDGRLAAFVLGFTGLRKGRVAHWSHMMAVRPELRDQGLGRRLKLYQRQALVRMGVETMYWSFDPLVARNAHLNLNRLGAAVDEYIEEMYAGMNSSLHEGLGTDRFVLEWDLTSARVEELARQGQAGGRGPGAGGKGDEAGLQDAEQMGPVVNARLAEDGALLPDGPDLSATGPLRVEIPSDIHQAKQAFPEAGRLWRSCTRRAFQHYLRQGYRVQGFQRDPVSNRCYYLLSKPEAR